MATQGSNNNNNNNNTTSRLAQMQLRYQQKQQQDREIKRAELIGNRPLAAIDTVDGKKLAGPLGTGKVRQMFDERRQRSTGIDKSYPLQPIAPRASSQTTVTTKTTTKTTWRSDGGNIDTNELDTTDGYTNRINGNYILSNKLDEGDFIDNEQFPESFSPPFDDNDNYINNNNISTKPPNIGKQMAGLNLNGNTFTMNNNNIKLKPVVVKKSATNPVKSINDTNKNGKKIAPLTTTRNKLTAITRNSPSSMQPQQNSSNSSTPTSASRPSSIRSTSTNNSNPSSANNSANGSNKTPVKKLATATSPTKVKRTPIANPPENSAECSVCGRYFNNDRIEKHEVICKKTATKKRKVFDVTKHRIKGTDAEQFVKKAGIKTMTKKVPAAAAASAPKKADWRRKHEEFIQAIRSAKELQAHLARGGKVSDIPPPPPSENPDYVQCPHCSRRFNESAASRHIPKCADFQFNKPKPAAGKNLMAGKRK